MASTLRDLLQRFTFWAAGIALVAVLVVAALAGRGAARALRRLADQRGPGVAARATALVANYVRERHGEADQLAANPSLIRAAIEAARSVAARRLDQVSAPVLERMFTATHQLGTDPDLARYVRGYPERSEFTDITVSERHGLVVTASGVPDRLQRRGGAVWEAGAGGGGGGGEAGVAPVVRGGRRCGAGALPGEGSLLLGPVSRAQRRRLRDRRGSAAIHLAGCRRPLRARRADDAVAGALAQPPGRGAGTHGGGCGRPRGERGPDRGGRCRRDGVRRDRRGSVVRAGDGRGAAAPGRRDPLGGGRGGGDGHGNLGLHRADERVDRGDVRHLPGPDQAGGRTGPAGARRGGRRDQDPPDRDDPCRRGRRLGTTQRSRRGRRPTQQGSAGPKHGAACQARRRGEPRSRGGRNVGTGVVRHPKVRDAGKSGGYADQHARPERGN